VLLEEVPSLTCRLSILCEFETCKHVYDWQVGVHGILINFTDAKQRSYTATYLPEVARDHGMTQASALRELVAKAGYTGPCDQYILSRMSVTRYQTRVETASYEDFLLVSEEDGSAGA
jgi:AMMECR1 domain-containing protein